MGRRVERVHDGTKRRGRLGKLFTLAVVLRDYHEELEYDLARLPGDDDNIPAFWAGRMSVRRLAVIVRQLLEDPASALLRAASPDPLWTSGDWIAADQYDLNAAALMGRKATPYPRPGDARREAEKQAQRMTALQAQQERIRHREALAGGDG